MKVGHEKKQTRRVCFFVEARQVGTVPYLSQKPAIITGVIRLSAKIVIASAIA